MQHVGRHRHEEFVAECFWPGVTQAALEALESRTRAAVDALAQGGVKVAYLGTILIRDDEVVLCRFAGTENAVRIAAERAEIPFERILEAASSPWSSHGAVRKGQR